MASFVPNPGETSQQLQQRVNSWTAGLVGKGENPGQYGMGNQAQRDDWSRQIERQRNAAASSPGGFGPQRPTPPPSQQKQDAWNRAWSGNDAFTAGSSSTPNMQAYAVPQFRPGQAQPSQSSQGTPYSPTQQKSEVPANRTFADAWNRSMEQYKGTPGMRITPAVSYGGEGQGNLAYASNRPAPFRTSVTAPWASVPSDPAAFANQRNAFIQRLNEERGRQSAQAGVYYGNEAPQFYRPSRDFGALWRGAGDMVASGWTNPLAGLFG